MDDNQTNEQASDETLVPTANTSEAENEEVNASEDEAKTGTEDEGTAEDSEAESSEDDEQDEDGKPKRKKRSGVERLKRRLDALEAENQALRSRQPVDSGDLEQAVLKEIGEPPKESDYPDYLAYERAMIAYEADKRQVTREIKRDLERQAGQQAARRAEVIEDHNERVAETRKVLPDYDKVLAKATDVSISPAVSELLLESEKGPLLIYHLAKNPQKAAELNRMPPLAAAKEIGRLEARLSLPSPNRTTKATAPTNPPKGGASMGPAVGRSMTDYERWRNSQG